RLPPGRRTSCRRERRRVRGRYGPASCGSRRAWQQPAHERSSDCREGTPLLPIDHAWFCGDRAPTTAAAPPLVLMAVGAIVKASRRERLDAAQVWFTQAKYDLVVARLLEGHLHHDWACLAAQQAAEKAIKAGWHAYGKTPPAIHLLVDLF